MTRWPPPAERVRLLGWLRGIGQVVDLRMTSTRIAFAVLSPLVMVAFLAGGALAQNPCGRLIPCPQLRTVQATSFEYASNRTFCIIYNSTLPLVTLQMFLDRVLTVQNGVATGFEHECAQNASCVGCSPAIQIILHQFGTTPPAPLPSTLQPFGKIGSDGYVLAVDKPGSSIRIAVGADEIAGLWNGAMTAAQLLLLTAGPADSVIAAQLIQDYPDHPARGAHWLDLKLGVNSSTGHFELTNAVREKVNFLRQHKISAVFYQEPEILFYDSNWTSPALGGRDGKGATSDLAAYCDSLLMSFVPAGGLVAAPLPCSPPGGGCDLNYPRLETVDGWWSGDQRFVFANVNPQGLQYNGSFELDWVDDGVSDGWENQGSRFDSYWAADHIDFYDGDVSMKLIQNATFRPGLWQQVGVPDSLPIGPKDYGLVVRVWRRGDDQGVPLEFRAVPRDSTGRTDESRQMAAVMPATQQAGWHKFTLTSPSSQLLRLKRGDRALEIRLRATEIGVDTIRVDRLQLLPVVSGVLDSLTDGLQEAVPGMAELLENGDMEEIETVPSLGNALLPAAWWTSSQSQVACWAEATSHPAAAVGWQADSLEKHSGKYSAHLTVPWTWAGSSNDIVLIQSLNDTFPAGDYRFTAWGKANWTNQDGSWPQINLVASNACGVDTVLAWDLLDRNLFSASGSSIGWCFYQGKLTLPSARANLTLYMRILAPSYGDIWIDDVSLRRLPAIEPMSNLLSNGNMEACCDTVTAEFCNCFPREPCSNVPMPIGWGPPEWGCLSSRTNGAAWSMVVSPTPSDSVHSGQHALKLVVPTEDANNPWVAVAQEMPGVFPPGKYLLSAWGRVGATLPAGVMPPNVTFVATSLRTHQPQWFTSVLFTSTSWTLATAVLPVSSDSLELTVRARFDAGGSGTLYLDDVALRRLDGSTGNLLTQYYQTVVRDTMSESTPYAPSATEVRRPLVTYQYFPDAAPGRVFRKSTSAIPANQAVRIAYDQYFNLPFVSADGSVSQRSQGSNISDGSILETFFLSRIDSLVRGGFPPGVEKNIAVPPSEIVGFNRTGLGRSVAGELLQSNAKRLSRFADTLMARARSVDANTVAYISSDLWSLYHNGGEWFDQAFYAGPIGRTADAIQSADTDSTLDHSARIVSWWYEPQYIANMTRSAQFFQSRGYMQLQATWFDTTNMTQAAALSIATPNCLGGVATTWPESGSDHELDIQRMVERFWNTPSKQVYFADFNPNEPSSGVATTGGVSVNTADTTLAMTLYPPGMSHGALKLASAAGSVTLPDIGIENSSQYQVILHARGAGSGYSGTKTVRVKPRWVRPNGTTFDGADSVRVVGGPGTDNAADFNRYTVALNRPASSTSADRLRLIVNVDAASTLVSADNICVWETVPACVNVDVALLVTPLTIALGTIPPGQYTVDFSLKNEGCRDIRVTTFSTSPAGKLTTFTPPAPLILPPGVTKAIVGRGNAAAGFNSYTLLISYRQSNPSTSQVFQQQITVTYTGEF